MTIHNCFFNDKEIDACKVKWLKGNLLETICTANIEEKVDRSWCRMPTHSDNINRSLTEARVWHSEWCELTRVLRSIRISNSVHVSRFRLRPTEKFSRRAPAPTAGKKWKAKA